VFGLNQTRHGHCIIIAQTPWTCHKSPLFGNSGPDTSRERDCLIGVRMKEKACLVYDDSSSLPHLQEENLHFIITTNINLQPKISSMFFPLATGITPSQCALPTIFCTFSDKIRPPETHRQTTSCMVLLTRRPRLLVKVVVPADQPSP
jgi:hypothetical protein